MIFWILLGLLGLSVVVSYFLNVFAFYNGWLGSLGWAVVSLIVGAFVAGIAFLTIAGCLGHTGVERKFVGDRTETLKALDTGSGISGRSYFLGGGYIGTTRVLNYMTQDKDGFVRLASADASVSAVKEDAEPGTARVKTYMVQESQYNLWPWPGRTYPNYEFHVPAGSVVESYTVDNK